jgi:Glyoxalase-like domain
MDDAGSRVRLRQAVLVATELEPVAAALRRELGLGEPFHDPGVGEFGLRNAVFALGDCFLEVVSPLRPDTAAGRYLKRRGGDAGYMVMFDLEDLERALERAGRAGVRVVWQIELPDIAGTHLHPGDMHGAIVSLDRSDPFGSWRWGGPQWTGTVSEGAPGRLAGVTLAVADPSGDAARWGTIMDVPVRGDGVPRLQLEGAQVRFATADARDRAGLVEIELELPDEVRRGRQRLELGGVSLRLRSTDGDR